jgi:hypothetical protein
LVGEVEGNKGVDKESHTAKHAYLSIDHTIIEGDSVALRRG